MKNKKHHAKWASLTGGNASDSRPKAPLLTKMLAIRKLPEIQRVEDIMLAGKLDRSLDARRREEGIAQDWAEATFNVSYNDTFLDIPSYLFEKEYLDSEETKIWDKYCDHEHQFFTDDLSDEELVVHFATKNIDVRQENGFPLRCIKPISRQLQAALLGIAGSIPTTTQLELDTFASSLQADAEQFLKSRNKKRII